MDNNEQIILRFLNWLEDAPLFIDEKKIDEFYDAVVQPQGESKEVTLQFTKEQLFKAGVSAKAGAEVEIGNLITKLFAKPKLSVETAADAGAESSKTTGLTVNIVPISTALRKLKLLTAHYYIKHFVESKNRRLFFVGDTREEEWRSEKTIKEVPRELVFIDFPSVEEAKERDLPFKTTLIPTAVEFENHKVVLLLDMVRGEEGEYPPVYRESPDERKKYWGWFTKNYGAAKAMNLIEKAASENGKILWIDFRVPIDNSFQNFHLHLTNSNDYPTGTFAYCLVKRGFRHGIRVVGTVKSEPDLNVLAIFEK